MVIKLIRCKGSANKRSVYCTCCLAEPISADYSARADIGWSVFLDSKLTDTKMKAVLLLSQIMIRMQLNASTT